MRIINLKTALIAVIISLSYAPLSHAETTDDQTKSEALNMADEMADCAGYLEGMSRLTERIGESDMAANFHNKSNGWLVAGAFLLRVRNALPAENIFPYVAERAKSAADAHAAKLGVNPSIGENFFRENCQPLVELQTLLADEARRVAYSQPSAQTE